MSTEQTLIEAGFNQDAEGTWFLELDRHLIEWSPGVGAYFTDPDGGQAGFDPALLPQVVAALDVIARAAGNRE